MRYGLTVSREVTAIHLTRLEGPDAKEHEGKLGRQWKEEVEHPVRAAGLNPPRLIISPSPYRSFVGRLLKHIGEIKVKRPGCPVSVVIPELVKEHWWDHLLHTSRSRQLRKALLRDGGPNLAVVMVPWAREEPHPEKVIQEEEPEPERPATRAPQPVR